MPKIIEMIDNEILKIDFSKYTAKEMFEVYEVNVDQRYISSVGYFENEKTAKGYASIQVDAGYHRTKKILVITDGIIGFELGKFITIFNGEEAKLEIAKKARAKLSDEEAEALGIE